MYARNSFSGYPRAGDELGFSLSDVWHGITSVGAKVEQAVRGPVNLVASHVIPGWSSITAATEAAKRLLSQTGAGPSDVTNATVAAGLQSMTNAARETAVTQQARDASVLSATFGLDPKVLIYGGLGLGALLLLRPARRRNPPRRRARRRARRR